MNEFLSNNVVQGIGFIARAFSEVVLEPRDFGKAYDDVLKAIAAFGLHQQVVKLAADLHTLDAKGELPKVK